MHLHLAVGVGSRTTRSCGCTMTSGYAGSIGASGQRHEQAGTAGGGRRRHGDGAAAARNRDRPALHDARASTRTTRSSGSAATRASRTSRTAATPSSSPTSSSRRRWSLNATNIVAQKYFRGTLGTPEREWSLRQVIDRVADTITDWGVARRLLRRRRRGRRVPRRAEVRPRAPARRVQLAGVVQHRREGRAAAGERVLHPRRRRHDGRDPQLVPGRGHDLQGRVGRRHQPVAASARRTST